MESLSPINPSLMRRAIELAMRGRGHAEPNPLVGCVLVQGDRIIGDGFHQKYGQAHAEPNALAACMESPAGATAYVTLEPCCHTNKQTPPCVPQLIQAKIARVVIGCLDPNPEVNGQGAQQLWAAGIQVVCGLLEAECKQLIAPFIAAVEHHRPYITLKWAQTADGKIAGAGGKPIQISNAISQKALHMLRGKFDAIAVGINTVLTDDPMLSVRHGEPARIPARYVLDRQLRTPADARLVQTAKQIPSIIATSEAHALSSRAGELRQHGVEVIAADTLSQVAADWHRRRFTHVLIEAGPTLAAAMMAENLADRLWIIRSHQNLNDPSASDAAAIPAHFQGTSRVELGNDVWTEYLNTNSKIFFTSNASPDFRLLSAEFSSPCDAAIGPGPRRQ